MTKYKTTFTQDIGDKICEYLEQGMTLRQACRQEGMPPEATVRTWVRDDVQGFHTQYTRARELGYQAMADELLEISDDGSNDYMEKNGKKEYNGDHMMRSRLRVDTRKWLLSKALPKMYGEKIDHTSSDGTMKPTVIELVGKDESKD